MNSKICFIRKYTHWRLIKLSQILEYNSIRIPFRQIKAAAKKQRQSELEQTKSGKLLKYKSAKTFVEVSITKDHNDRHYSALDVQFPKNYERQVNGSEKSKSESVYTFLNQIIDLFNISKKKLSYSALNKITPLQAQRKTSLINTKNYLTSPLESEKINNVPESRLLKQVRLLNKNARQLRMGQIQQKNNQKEVQLRGYLSIMNSIRNQKMLMNKSIPKQSTNSKANQYKWKSNILAIYLLLIFVLLTIFMKRM